MAIFFKRPKPVILIIVDGMGVASPGPGNAVTLAKTPSLDKYWPSYPHTYLKASGLDVGLPSGVDGNSEVGHINIGSGRVIYQNLPRINLSIKNKSFFENPTILKGFDIVRQKNSNIHLMGLIGGGQVHSSINHLFALIKMISDHHLNGDKVFLHLFTDGRDSPPKSAADYIQQIEMHMNAKSVGHIASIIGRYFAMDRDLRWNRTQKAYDLITQNNGTKASTWMEALDISYREGITDEYIEPFVIYNGKTPVSNFTDNDLVLFFNYRSDRAIQLTKAFADPSFNHFERTYKKDIYYCGFTNYGDRFPKNIIFQPETIDHPLGEILSNNRLTQLRIAESEKFPHVTYFFDGGNEIIYPGEDTIEVPSPKDVATYDQKPEMSAEKVTDIILKKIDEDIYDFILVNFANLDMVAHTGVIKQAVKATEFVDKMIGKITTRILDHNGVVFITADHGNTEEMIDLQTGSVDTKHSTNLVPFIMIKRDETPRELSIGILSDIAPTILGVMGLEKPPYMTGRNLLT